jgi:hypothetical protein
MKSISLVLITTFIFLEFRLFSNYIVYSRSISFILKLPAFYSLFVDSQTISPIFKVFCVLLKYFVYFQIIFFKYFVYFVYFWKYFVYSQIISCIINVFRVFRLSLNVLFSKYFVNSQLACFLFSPQ